MISINELTVKYKGVTALDCLSLSIKKGEKLALLGQNGAGKSSLLKSLTGDIPQVKGNINIEGTLGILPEGALPYANLKVYEYLEYIGHLKGCENPAEEGRRVISLCQLENKSDQLTTSLSKGLKQRIMLAAALTGDPDIIVLDEPTSGLDPLFQKVILDIIKKSSKGRTIIFSTHNIGEAFTIADRVVVLKDGKISFNSKLSNNRSTIVRFSGEPLKFPVNSTKISSDTISINGPEYKENVKAAIQWCEDNRLELLEIKDSRDWSYLYEFF